MIFDPAKLTPTKRALGTFCAIAAGTAAAVTAGPLVAAGVTGVAGLLTNFLANDIERIWNERTSDPKYNHPNHDLERLVGDAIALVLFGKSREAGSKEEQRKFQLIAQIACVTYVDFAEQPAVQELASYNLPELFRRAAEQPGQEVPLLTPSVWQDFVTILAAKLKLKFKPQQIATAAQRLHVRLLPAIREMVKRNFDGDGRAYAALSLDLSSTLLNYAVKNQAQHGATQQQLQLLFDKLDSIQTTQRAALTPEQAHDLSWLATEFAQTRQLWRETHRQAQAAAEQSRAAVTGIVKVHEQQQLDSERLDRIEALLKQQLANKTVGEDPTQKQFPPELIAQAKLLLERGNQEQQALAEIALNNFDAADALIQELKRNPLAEAFRLLMLEGDNCYQAGKYDQAIEPYEQALALQPKNLTARNNAAVALLQAQLGDIADNQARSIAIHQGTLKLLQDQRGDAWAITQGNMGSAWLNMPTGDRVANLGRAIECYEAALTFFQRDLQPDDWARNFGNLGYAWLKLPTGDREANVRRALEYLHATLMIYTPEQHPADWARTQSNLGLAWIDLPTGVQAENLRRALDCFTAALMVYRRDTRPVEWGRVHCNLGTVWFLLPTGDHSANLTRAVECCEAALTVCTREQHPADWAKTQTNLGNAWLFQQHGNRSENVQRAGACYQAALTVYTRDAHPLDWAMTQNNLGIAWSRLPTGDAALNLQRSLACAEAAQTVYTRAAHPAEWAKAESNRGDVWLKYPTGDHAANLARAIECYESALTVYTRDKHPLEWATTQNSLGLAWTDLPRGDLEGDLARARACYEAALTIYTRTAHPNEWAGAQSNLGHVWLQLPTGDPAENLQRALECCDAALTVYTREAMPLDWAATMNNRALVLVNRPSADQHEQMQQVRAAYEAALEVYTRADHPADWAQTHYNLAIVYSALAALAAAETPADVTALLRRSISSSKAALLIYTPDHDLAQHSAATENLAADRAAYEAAGGSNEIPFDDIPPAA